MLIVGNLDVETTWARMDAAARRARGEKAPRPDDPRFALPEPVMRKISAAATLMRVFASSDDDVLWTPRPVEPSRMARVEWLPTPRLESGPMPETVDVWWGEPTERAMLANHRSLVLDIRSRAGSPDIGAAMVSSLDELQARASGVDAWVAKAPFSAAGRLRVRGPLSDASRSQAAKLIDLYGGLLFEPWLPRSDDFSVACQGGGATVAFLSLEVDSAGRFRGVSFRSGLRDERSLSFLNCFIEPNRVEARWPLDHARRDFKGPFGLDMFHVPDGEGGTRLHLSEVNARHTFGYLAAVLFLRWCSSVGMRDAWPEPMSLRFGRGAPPPSTIPLLLPGADDDTSAWLETPSRHGV